MNRASSIFTKLNLLFAFAFALTTLIALVAYGLDAEDARRERMLRAIGAFRVYLEENNPEEMSKQLERLEFAETPERSAQGFELMEQKQFAHGAIRMFLGEGSVWVELQAEGFKRLLKDVSQPDSKARIILLAYLLGGGVLLGLFVMLRKNLLPLRTLVRAVQAYGREGMELKTHVQGSGEIALLGDELEKAARRIRELQSARTLFLRNIMHELKTPLTKGRICLQFFPENENRELMEGVFARMEQLIEEMAEVEKLVTQQVQLHPQPYRVVDLVDGALELLFLEPGSIPCEGGSISVSVDYRLFCIALKNLIDNARKYGQEGWVALEADPDTLSVLSHGDPLEAPFSSYVQPFYKELHQEVEKNRGFGLGLYITHEIARLHGFSLGYHHEPKTGENRFFIRFG